MYVFDVFCWVFDLCAFFSRQGLEVSSVSVEHPHCAHDFLQSWRVLVNSTRVNQSKYLVVSGPRDEGTVLTGLSLKNPEEPNCVIFCVALVGIFDPQLFQAMWRAKSSTANQFQ